MSRCLRQLDRGILGDSFLGFSFGEKSKSCPLSPPFEAALAASQNVNKLNGQCTYLVQCPLNKDLFYTNPMMSNRAILALLFFILLLVNCPSFFNIFSQIHIKQGYIKDMQTPTWNYKVSKKPMCRRTNK